MTATRRALRPAGIGGRGCRPASPAIDSRAVESETWRVEPAGAADAPAVVRLIGRVFAEYGFVFDPATELPDLLAFDRHYAPPRGAFFVIRDRGDVVGSVGVERHPDGTAELHRLYLDVSLRGRGLGRALVERVLAWCRAEGINHLILWSDTRFERAHALYARLGFRRTAERILPDDPNQTREYRFERPVGPGPA